MAEKKRPEIGARVMRPYGRREYTDYGEIGTVTAHAEGYEHQLSMTLDDFQPFARWMYGSKAKATGHERVMDRLGTREVIPLAEVYQENARRFRSVAKDWARRAQEVTDA